MARRYRGFPSTLRANGHCTMLAK